MTRLCLAAGFAAASACSGELPQSSGDKFEENWSFEVPCNSTEQYLIRDRASWKALWIRMHPDGEPVPYVDFDTDSVIAGCDIFNYGAWYEITAWEPADPGRVTVYDTIAGLGSNCVGAMILASGFHAIRIEGTFNSADFTTVTAGREACTNDPALGIDKPPGWKPLADGYFSGCTEPSERLIRSDEDWAAFWTLLHAGMTPEPERPAVDFANESVIATCLGTRQDGGFAARLMHMTDPDADGRVVVGVRDYLAAADCGEPVATQAYHLIRVNRPLGGVTFRRRTVVYACASEG